MFLSINIFKKWDIPITTINLSHIQRCNRLSLRVTHAQNEYVLNM